MTINEQEFKAKIEYARALSDYNKTELAKRIKMPPTTFFRKMDRPSKLTLEEFFLLNEALPHGNLIEYLKESIKREDEKI